MTRPRKSGMPPGGGAARLRRRRTMALFTAAVLVAVAVGSLIYAVYAAWPREDVGVALPPFLDRASRRVRLAYAFAAQNPDILRYIPCFCGCEAHGHTSNADCYVRSRDAAGQVAEWDRHGFG